MSESSANPSGTGSDKSSHPKTKGAVIHIMALLRPARSMRKPPSRMEVTQPRGNTEAIQLPIARLKSKSQSPLQSEMCGRTGDVHASPLPWANAPRHAEKKRHGHGAY